jgi:ferredoxin-type protein NapG
MAMAVQSQQPDKSRREHLDRRQFLGDMARTAAAVAICGLPLGLYIQQSRALPGAALRPPGALAEDDFVAACVRCGLCVRDCPYDTLTLASLGDGVPTGTPYFIARQVPCEMCDDIPCVVACPTGALDEKLTDINDAEMGVAAITDTRNCLNYQGLRCDVCYRVCPLIDEAIRLVRSANVRTGKHAHFIPTVDADKCTGCGKCERACVLEESAIRVIPMAQAMGKLGAHYRLGWEEKDKFGPAIKDIIDLPDRRPEGQP